MGLKQFFIENYSHWENADSAPCCIICYFTTAVDASGENQKLVYAVFSRWKVSQLLGWIALSSCCKSSSITSRTFRLDTLNRRASRTRNTVVGNKALTIAEAEIGEIDVLGGSGGALNLAGRHRPEELATLAANTRFTKKEIQLIYRGFKQECPSGLVDEDDFKKIFAQFFPQGGKFLFSSSSPENIFT